MLIFLGACVPKNDSKTEEFQEEPLPPEIILPEGAIPFIFNDMVLMNFTVNDSLTGTFIFDSGSDQLYLDSLFVAENNITANPGNKKKIMGVGDHLHLPV